MQRNYRAFSHCAGSLLSLMVLGSVANPGDWAFLMVGTLGHAPAAKADSQLLPVKELNQAAEASAPAVEPVKKHSKSSDLSNTVRRYRDSGRIMILGGPEAFAL